MANPPVRPWFRLTSIRPVPTPTPAPAPAPAPAPEPRPTLSLPTYRTSSAPSSPQTKPQDKTTQQHHHSDKPSSPPRKAPYPQAQPQDKTTTTTTQRTSTPSSPARKTIPYSSSSLPSSPIQKTTHSHSQTQPTSSPEKTIKQPLSIPVPVPVRSPVHSPNSKSSIITSAPPPSPLTLPPSHFKPEQHQQQQPKIPMEPEHKAVLVQKTVVDKPNPHPHHNNNSSVDKPNPHHKNSSGESHRETRNAHHGKHHVAAAKERDTKERKVLDSDDSGNMRVITIAGENRGAYMELVHSPKKHGPKYLHKKGNTKDAESEGSSAEEGNKNKDKNHKGRTASSFPMAAYMNSNVQCVNNSLLYHASCSHHDPGLHLSLKKKPSTEGFHFKEHVNGHRNN